MKLSALLLALCLLLALAFAPALSRAQDAAEESSEESSEASEASEESSEASEESSNEETASRSVQQVPNVGGGRVTLVSNKNTLTHIASAPKVINHYAIEEQERKSSAEAALKRKDEQGVKQKQEQTEKDAKKKEQDQKKVLEEKKKQAIAEQSAKKLAEQKTKAQIALAKQKAESQAKLAKTREAAAKKNSRNRQREAVAKRRARAVEQRRKHHHRRRREAAAKRAGSRIRLHGYRDYWHGYARSRVTKWHRMCVLEGLITGSPSLVGYLPSHCRPYHGRLIFTSHRGRESRVDVLPDGRIYYITGRSASWLSLNGLTFDTHRVRGLHLVHGWRNYGYGYRATARTRIGELCAISGLIRHGRWGYQAHVGHDCRPHRRLIFSGNNHHHISRLDVASNGYALWSGGYRSHHWVSFDGMIYLRGWGGHHLPLYNGWRHYHSGYRAARYRRYGRLCMLSGLIRGHWRHHITTLPRGCRPARRLIFGANVHNHNARVDILPDGRVLYINRRSRYNWLSLSNIHFIARR